jgi:hypothetical protein
MTNCFWVAEDGAFEICIDEGIAPLPGGYVVWDDAPEVLAGRSAGSSLIGNATWVEVVASPNLIVMAVNTDWGISNTWKSYMVVVSDDHGFTFSGGIDKAPFVDGSNVGFMATDYDAQWNQHFGTSISYDEEGDEFFIVEGTLNDEGWNTSKVLTHRSTDGVNWTTVLSDDVNHVPVLSEAYNGTVWYLGCNIVAWNNCFPSCDDAKLSIRASEDGGITWAGQIIGNANFETFESITKDLCRCEANAQGLHVIDNAYYDSTDTGMFYFRPTSKTTWAAPFMLWPNTYSMANTQHGSSDFFIASRANPGTLYVGLTNRQFNTYIDVVYRKSSDNGLTWSPDATAWSGTSAYYPLFSNQGTYNGIQVVELADGRLVLIMFGYNDATDKYLFAYAVNNDGLTSGFGSHTFLEPDINIDRVTLANYTPRFEATNKVNDVVLVFCNDQGEEQRSLVFRP